MYIRNFSVNGLVRLSKGISWLEWRVAAICDQDACSLTKTVCFRAHVNIRGASEQWNREKTVTYDSIPRGQTRRGVQFHHGARKDIWCSEHIVLICKCNVPSINRRRIDVSSTTIDACRRFLCPRLGHRAYWFWKRVREIPVLSL